ncbi:MAG: Zn-ribbon domain-containing OB-fold protein [Deltaproteobacteria bacterium]|nr:Zn-ribbon domain-containing OB-fold protein [Deltaproteobacteria bacterium]MBI3386792.1 Zn-ribbon domain-containing OB-fold protein [Deltaproteobacteria bacterium]
MEQVSIRAGLFSIDPPRLLGGRCEVCRRYHFPAQSSCPYCAADDCVAVPLSEHGTLYLYTVVRNAPPGFRGTAPYGFGVVELPEGVRIISPLTEARLDALRIGMPVRLRIAPLFTDDDAREVLSYAFEPVTPSPSGRGQG